MRYLFVAVSLTLVLHLSCPSSSACAAQFSVDAARSELVARLFKAGVAAPLAHNHVIRAVDFSGKADVDFENPANSSITVEVRADTLKADEAVIRQKYDLDKPMTEKDRQQIQHTMESEGQMDVKQYPTMRFQSTRIDRLLEGQYLVTGVLTIHGVKHPVSFLTTVVKENGNIRGGASFHIKQSDFGIHPYSAFLGAVRNRDEVVLNIELVLAPSEQAASDKEM